MINRWLNKDDTGATLLPYRDHDGRDLILFAIILVLAFGGLLCLQSISATIAENLHNDASYFVKRQALWLLLGLIMMLVLATVRLELIEKAATVIMLISLCLLLLVFVPGIGKSIPSSHGSFSRWLNLGFISIQPSEFSKLALVVFLAHIMTQEEASETRKWQALTKPALLIIPTLIAILLEPQYGTTICILSFIFIMIYSSGFPLLRLLVLGLSFLPLLGILLVFWPYRLKRFYTWLDPYEYRFEGGYQLVTSYRAFQDGSWLGQKLSLGLAHRYLPYGHTDFALALLAEDFGWIGVCLLLIVFVLFMWRSLVLIKQIMHKKFCTLLASGILIMIILQVILNLFVVTGLIPTTGIGLPFFSYGGSLLISTLGLCGLLLNATRIQPDT